VVKTEGRVFFLGVNDIHCIEGRGQLRSCLYGQKDLPAARNYRGLESQLNPKTFLRIHRSSIVRIDKIRNCSRGFMANIT